MNITLIAPTYKRNDICNRLINSVPDWINIVVVNLDKGDDIIRKDNVHIEDAKQMPVGDAYNFGVQVADRVFPDTEAYLLTDDDVYFIPETIIGDNIFNLLKIKDTGLVAITRVINSIKVENKHIKAPFIYKGGGYFIRKEVFHEVGGYNSYNSADEWDICIKTFVNGYKNYRTKSSYAIHKQGTARGGLKEASREGSNVGKADMTLTKYVETKIVTPVGYENFSGKETKFNKLAFQEHKIKNLKIWQR